MSETGEGTRATGRADQAFGDTPGGDGAEATEEGFHDGQPDGADDAAAGFTGDHGGAVAEHDEREFQDGGPERADDARRGYGDDEDPPAAARADRAFGG